MRMLRSSPRHGMLLAAMAILIAVSGCAKKAVEAPPATEPAPPQVEKPPAPAEKQPETPAPAPAPHTFSASDLQPVFFDFDSYALRDDGRSALDSNAKLLRDNPSLAITIEGHCDERGTAEYNQALGERRAQAARDYLAAAGIAATRMQVISYGKERPFDQGHDEAAWQKNRRAHFVVRS